MSDPTGVREAQWLREGYALLPDNGRFVPAIARLFYKMQDDHVIFRVEVGAEHCNGFGIAHGGFLATLADTWLAYNVGRRLPQATRFVTAGLNVDFLKPVQAGSWLESEMDRIKTGRRLCHAAGAILCDGSPAVAMRATFAVISAPET